MAATVKERCEMEFVSSHRRSIRKCPYFRSLKECEIICRGDFNSRDNLCIRFINDDLLGRRVKAIKGIAELKKAGPLGPAFEN
jgi:hypothetical protein